MRTFFITACYASFLLVGWGAPFVFTLGYVWVDSFVPQRIAYSLLNEIPVSQIVALAAVVGYASLDRRDLPRMSLLTFLLIVFVVWVSVSTLFWAVVPVASDAPPKWGTVVKTLCVTMFYPLVIRTRIQIEAFLQVWLFGFAINFLPSGLKAVISGGAYGRDLGIHGNGAGGIALAADSRLAMLSLMFVPIIFFLRRHTKILPRHWLTSAMYLTIIAISFGAAYGTYERTGVVVAAVLAVLLWSSSQRKLLFGGALVLLAVVALHFVPADWMNRMETISEYKQDWAAASRLEVWKWVVNYAVEHPLGGGFNIYMIDHLGAKLPDGTRGPLAYHNDFMEVLGEQGWPGLLIFVAIIVTSFYYLREAARRAREFPQLSWCRDLAVALQMALVLQLTGGMFVALGYQPPLYMVFALALSLREYVYRVERLSESTEQGALKHDSVAILSGSGASSDNRAAIPQRFRHTRSLPHAHQQYV